MIRPPTIRQPRTNRALAKRQQERRAIIARMRKTR